MSRAELGPYDATDSVDAMIEDTTIHRGRSGAKGTIDDGDPWKALALSPWRRMYSTLRCSAQTMLAECPCAVARWFARRHVFQNASKWPRGCAAARLIRQAGTHARSLMSARQSCCSGKARWRSAQSGYPAALLHASAAIDSTCPMRRSHHCSPEPASSRQACRSVWIHGSIEPGCDRVPTSGPR